MISVLPIRFKFLEKACNFQSTKLAVIVTVTYSVILQIMTNYFGVIF